MNVTDFSCKTTYKMIDPCTSDDDDSSSSDCKPGVKTTHNVLQVTCADPSQDCIQVNSITQWYAKSIYYCYLNRQGTVSTTKMKTDMTMVVTRTLL